MNRVQVQLLTVTLVLILSPGVLTQLSPQFTSDTYTTKFNQNLLAGDVVLSVVCNFEGIVNYSLGSTNVVMINQQTGSIYLAVDALAIPVSNISTSVICSESGNVANANAALLNINRIEENAHPPSITHTLALTVSFNEDTPVNSPLVDINATDDDLGMFGVIQYSILGGNDLTLFAIDTSSGVVSLQNPFNFENHMSHLILVGTANLPDPQTGTVESQNVPVTIIVQDIDDVPPVFKYMTYEIVVTETVINNLIAGMNYPRPSPGFLITNCTDDDTPSEQISYSIVSEGSIYPLILNTGNGYFSVVDDLDYETRTSFTFNVVCYDNSLRNSSGIALVNIAVLPINEAVPDCVDSLRPVFFSETIAIGEIVATANPNQTSIRNMYSCTDMDDGPDGYVTFSLDEESLDSRFFSLDRISGDLTISEELDNDDPSVMLFARGGFRLLTLSITGCDEFPASPVCENFELRIFVTTVNEFDPIIAQSRYNRSFPESYLVGGVILSANDVSCTDQDRGLGALDIAHVEIVTTSQIVSQIFFIDVTSGEITLREGFDYEREVGYGFEIRCYDNNEREDRATITVDIEPENDNLPHFNPRNYIFNVSRTTPPSLNSVIGRVFAQDADVDFGGNLQFSVESNGFVDINEEDGELLLFNSVLNISETTISFLTFVNDENVNYKDNVLVVLQLTEGNSVHPQFVDGSATIEVSELVMPGETVLDLLCVDSDTGLNGQIQYYFDNDNVDDAFSIDMNTGRISVNNVLTVPENVISDIYSLSVICEDMGVPVLRDYATVVIIVFRDDSNPPVIANKTINLFISEDTPTGTLVATIQAIDIDANELNYRLENQSSPGTFVIDSSTGELTVERPLDREMISQYHMTVIVIEVRIRIGPERSDSAVINVFVRDVNDNEPVCTPPSYSFSLDETVPVGEIILQLQCSDPDIEANGILTYTLISEMELLAIDAATGEITVANFLNGTNQTSLDVQVAVADNGYQVRQQITVNVFISITFSNRNQPMFTNLPSIISVSEAQPLQDVIFSAMATDPDRGNFGRISYGIVGEERSTFSIFSNTGGLFLNSKLNFFDQSQHMINITATDSEFLVSEVLTVIVLDANEFSPTCDFDQQRFNIPESVAPSEISFQRLLCSDDDQGTNGELVYNIESGDDGGVFHILSDGTVTTLQILDYEDIQQYQLEIRVSDGGFPPAFVLKMLEVIVNPVNEYAPLFEQDSYEQSIVEGTAVGTDVLLVVATDGDRLSHVDGQIVYSIVGLEESFFAITRSGRLQVTDDLNREVHNSFSFSIQATDLGVPALSSNTSITITILDIDDNPPQFTEDLYLFAVNDSALQGRLVGVVSCVDLDVGDNSIVTYSFDGTESDVSFFSIGNTGVIEIQQDLSVNSIHTFTVHCTGPSPLNRSDSATVSVRVLLDTTITFFPSSVYVESIREDTVPVADIVILNGSSSTGATLTYQQLNLANLFDVDDVSGVVRLIATLDFELTESYSLMVEATDGGNPPVINEAVVHIMVININDENPVIITDPLDIFVVEGLINSTQVLEQYQCLDGDNGPLGEVSFQITAGNTNQKFSISSSGVLSLVSGLDSEVVSSYDLEIVCQDGGQPPRLFSVTVSVNVIAINDNSPQFTDISNISVVESLPTGTSIGTAIRATDMDTSPHNIIRYTIASGNTMPPTFAISATTGQLTLQRSLNYEVLTEYSLVIRIDDSGGLDQANQFPTLSTSSTVTISIIDVNDNSPMFTNRFYRGFVDETALIGDLVIFTDPPVCTDEDSELNGDTVLSILEDVPFSVSNRAIITVAGSLDFETLFFYRLTLRCSDPDQMATAFLQIVLLDVDEHRPEFMSPSYTFTVAENSAPGILVGTILATDEDTSQMLMYSFTTGGSVSEFILDPNSGNIILQESIDFEQQQLYFLTVEVIDTAGNTDMALVNVQVGNVNDNSPMFTAARYFQSIRENSVVGTAVGDIDCLDADNEAEDIPLNYTIVTSDVPFEIDGSGTIGVSGSIDLEEISRYAIEAQCIDSGGLTVTVDVTIDILPFNDFAPLFIFPRGPNSTIHISEGIRIGDTVRRIIAYDEDVVSYLTITYTIVNGNEDGYFSLDPANGFLRMERNVDREEQARYVLNLKAENVIPLDDDSGSLPLSSNLELTIIVDDINDNSPTISPSNPLPVILVESNSSFIDIAFFVCFDPDDGDNGRTVFSISSLGLADSFEISDAGVVRTISRISTSVIVDITCSDFGVPPRSTSVSLAVNSITANEHSPVFPETSYTFMLPEDYPLNTDFLCFNATDMDGADNPDGVLKYSLLLEHPQDDFSRFSIRENTGCLFVVFRLNYDVSSLYIYQVTASDTGDEPLHASVQIRLAIQDTIPAPPTFQNTPYNVILFENEESGTQAVQVICSDIDQDDNVTYAITGGNSQSIFQIDSLLGSIFLAPDQTVDYEISTIHFLTVSCIDTHNLQATAVVTLTVLPINEFTPTFISGPFSIEENSIIGTVVHELQYFDGDDGSDGEVSFSLISSVLNDAFSLSPNGRISVNGSLDRETLDFYSFEVQVSDLSINPAHRRSSLNQVNITILDQNDNRPAFELDTYTFGPLAGDETLGFVVGVTVCTDLDLGENALVTYSVVESSVAPSLFNVQSTTGELFVSGDLSTRQLDDIVLFIQCTDTGAGMLSATARLLIQVTEVNRNAPEFLNSSYFAQVPEDSEIFNDVILTITAQDRDTGINGQVRYALENNLDLTFFINEDTGEITLLKLLDFEMRTEYSLVVEARDGATDSATQMLSRVNVTIEVIGVNEFPPQCVDPIYTAVINRMTLGNVIDFQCSDDDAGPDGTLTYQIVSGDTNNQFSVNMDGILTVPNLISPDASSEQIALDILISDDGSPPRQTEIETIIIYSYDNLNSPFFEFPEYDFNVSELIDVGVIFGNVVAVDLDPGLQGQIMYSISGTLSFRVDPMSGDLFVGQSLDWETAIVHTFTLIAQDRDPFSPRQGSTTVTVTVNNENDNLPQCSQVFYSIEIPSNTSIGNIVLLLNCEDLDQTPLQYKIESLMPIQSTIFAIERDRGRIYVSESLVPFTSVLFKVLVIGNELETINVTVNIIVRFINILPPMFDPLEFFILVAEDSPLLSVVGTITATDLDSRQSDLIYSISESLEFFVDPSTGDVVLTSPLDFESVREYSFVVHVMDSGSYDDSNELTSSASLNIDIINVNDNSPVFNNDGLYGASVSETTAVETDIVSIICEDNDSPPYGSPNVTSSNLFGSPFSLVQTGEVAYVIEVSSSLSGPSSYIFNISCTDGGSRTNGQVYIFVPEPLAPEFTQPLYEWFLSENAESGDDYTLVQASSNDGSSVTYIISDGNGEGIFYINPTSGVVSLVTSVDYETQRSHAVIVRAIDGNGRQANVLMIAHVLDENDEIPLTPPSALLSVSQNSPFGFPIGVLVCTDRDTIDNATSFSFNFTSDSELFSVDEFGIVRLEGVLSDTPIYSLPVICFDLNHPEDISMGVVTIEVEFVNLNHPVFNSPLYTFFIREDVEPLTFVGQILATDEDVGSFGTVAYTIIDGNPNHFFMEASTGQIGVLTSLDREMIDSYTLTVVAYDGGSSASQESRLNQTVIVEIFVEDVNDNPPMPVQLSYVQSITTNHSLLSPVLSVECLDPDLLNNGIVNYSLEPQSLEDFVIQQDGTLLLAREQTNQAVYNLFVVCADQGDPRLSFSAIVVVIVDFISLSAPVFDQEEYNITIDENIPIGSSLLQVHAESTDSSIGLIYGITGGNDLNRFHINPLSGIILVTNDLDASVQQLFVLTISATITDRTALSSLSNVNIMITDLNDNSPQFPTPFYSASVTEHVNILTPVLQVNCTDADVGADISYSIQYSLDLFSITREGLIIVAGDIDFETNTSHTFEVICTDGGESPQVATTSVHIEVLPLNEFVPVFTQTKYNFTASENSFGALIGQLEAVDGDAGIQGLISYFLQDPSNTSVVLVNSQTGEVLIANNLDYEMQTFWDLTVIARDGAGAESHTLLHIDVENLNDVPPVISPTTAISTISSDDPAGFPIQSFTCSDADRSQTSLRINSGNNLGLFQLDFNNVLSWTGQGHKLDANAVISLNLICVDTDSPVQQALGYIAVRIQVTNAPPPVFTEAVYMRNISESAEIGTVVLTITATSDSMNITYSLFNLPMSFPFGVDEVSGEITLDMLVNREDGSLYTFFVGATDLDTLGVGVVLVEIRVEDANDNAPVIFPEEQTVTLQENFGVATEFIRFLCTDNDVGINGQVDFELTSENTLNTFSILQINSGIGSVSLSNTLDFETERRYSVVVECIDRGLPPLTASATLTVIVSGVNEFVPTFSQEDYIFYVNETSEAGYVVGTVTATDMDEGVDGILEYRISPILDYQHFTINSIGELRTSSLPLNASVNEQLQISILAIDSGGLSNSSLVNFNINDINSVPVLSDFGNYFVTLSSNETTPLTILEFFCYDIDINNNADLHLQFLTVPSNIVIETVSTPGLITATVTLNGTLSAGAYDLPLTCSDSGSPGLSATAIATVQIQGMNTAPTFNHGSVFMSVLENVAPGTSLFVVNASDAETGVTYAITGGSGRGTFTINPDSGRISLFLPIDYETISDYLITVTAYDQSVISPLLARLLVAIAVINVNDEFPIVQPQGIQQITVSENEQPGFVVQSYTCRDPDGSPSVMFRLSPLSPDLPFRLRQSGELLLESSLNFEIQGSYELDITCTDREVRMGEGVTLSSTVTLIINVLPINTSPPVFEPPFDFSVPESAMPGDAIAQVRALDSDMRGQITYFSMSVSDIFVVERMSGRIILLNPLDYEASDREYSLLVEASDNDIIQGVSARSSNVIITLRITDVNDNAPVCQSLIISEITIGTYSFIYLTQLICSDLDSGNNSALVYSFAEPLPSIERGELVINNSTGEVGFEGEIVTPGALVINVIVSDRGDIPQQTNATVVVLVTLSDNSSIQFDPNTFNISVFENVTVGTEIFNGTVLQTALINPTGSDAVFTLRLTTENSGSFIIDQASGSIIVVDNTPLDFESNRRYFPLVVDAVVGSSGGSAVVIQLSLLDTNDNAPMFEQPLISAMVSENLPASTSILQVVATDADSTTNGEFMYSIEDSVDFYIHPDSGIIRTLLPLDRETNSLYSFFIIARDFGTPSLTGSALVTVDVLDQNDEPPVFASSVNILSTNNLSPPGTLLLLLEVTDNDITNSIRFQLITSDTNVRQLFAVDPLSGMVSRGPADFPVNHSDRYSFTVQVSDGINVDMTVIIVYIASVTTDSIVFRENVRTEEYDLRGFLILQNFEITLNATYEITEGDGNNEFVLSPTGVLTTRNALDRENTPEYTLMIHVEDQSSLNNIDVVVTVRVQDMNDNAPTFSAKEYLFCVLEDTYQDPFLIGAVLATDIDQINTNAATIEYSIVGATYGTASEFKVHPQTGEVFVKQTSTLDRERYENHTLVIRARDLGEPRSLFSSVSFVVCLNDTNDNDPEFVPVDVIEYVILLGKAEVPRDTVLDNIIAILPKSVQQSQSVFMFSDRDTTSTVTANVSVIGSESKFKLTQNTSANTATLTSLSNIIEANDKLTLLQIALSDEINEDNYIVRNISLIFDSKFEEPITAGLPGQTPFFQTDIGIAVIVVICMIIMALLLFVLCMSCYCYMRYKREKDPLHNRDRMITVAQRLRTETDRRGRKGFGRPLKYLTYSNIDPLDFPEFSPLDNDTQLLYSPDVGGEFESSFMEEKDDTKLGNMVDPFNPSTDTSVLSSLPVEDQNSDSGQGYSMGPVLRALLEEWDRGDELLTKSSKKKKKKKAKNEEKDNTNISDVYY